MSDSRSPWGLATGLAVLLAAATVFFAVRTRWWSPEGPPEGGVFGRAGRAPAEAVITRLGKGLVSRQRADGSYDLGDEYSYEIERLAATALATAALAAIHDHGGIEVPGLPQALAKGLDHLKKKQIETGPIGYEEPKDRWSQVDATSAAVLAFVLADREEDREALARAGAALRRFARARLRNGWTRGLGVITTDLVLERDLDDAVFDGRGREIVDLREMKQLPREGPPQTSDWNVAEVICRVVLGLKKGIDPFPAALTQAVLDEPAEWNYPSTDCAAWWMQGWLVARSGSKDARGWFEGMRTVLDEQAIREDGTVQGGWYANTVTQTSGAILALIEGLSSQVVAR